MSAPGSVRGVNGAGRGSSVRDRVRPLGPSMLRSTAHARLAISSRRNRTSSRGAPSITTGADGGRNNPGRLPTGSLLLVAKSRKRPVRAESSTGPTATCSPKDVVQLSASTVTYEPYGASRGMTSQSLA